MPQIKAAQLMAKGHKNQDIWPQVKTSEATFYRWKKLKAFQNCLAFFQEQELATSAAISAEREMRRDTGPALYGYERLHPFVPGQNSGVLTAYGVFGGSTYRSNPPI